MNIVQNTFTSSEVVLLSEMKMQLRVDSDDEDLIIQAKTRAAASIVEQYCNRVLLSATFTAYCDLSDIDEDNTISIYKFPITAISSVKYYNSSGVLTTLVSGTDYFTDFKGCPVRIKFLTIPTVQANIFNPIEIAYTAGHTDTNSIDEGIKDAIKIITGQLYEQRQNESSSTLNESSLNYKTLLSLYVKGSYL